jgi:hypothetical protein
MFRVTHLTQEELKCGVRVLLVELLLGAQDDLLQLLLEVALLHFSEVVLRGLRGGYEGRLKALGFFYGPLRRDDPVAVQMVENESA